MVTTSILGEAAGVQHAGLQDRATTNIVQGITNGLIIGKFKRGRTDQPMLLTKDTVRARLGHEPTNPFYQIVQDCLDKFPAVWVLRVASTNTSTSDYAYLSAPLHGIHVDVFENGEWVRINDANDSDNDDQSVIARLLSHGIGVFKTFDGLGCFDLYRFQSMINSQKNIAVTLVNNWWAGNGIMVLTPQANQSINKLMPSSESGYNRVELTLLPDNTFIPEQYINSFSPQHNLRFFKINSETSESYRYKFEVDNVPVNNPNGSTEFILSNTASLDNVRFALEQSGIRSNWYFDQNEVQTEFECLVTGAYKTLKVRQQASAIAENEYIDYGAIENEGINVIDKSPTNYQLEYSLYDPIDLELE